MLTNVLSLADGTGRRARRNRNALRVALIYQREDHFQAQIDYRGQAFTVTVGDSIPNIGIVELIDRTQVIIQTGSGIKSYPAPNREINGENGENVTIKVSSRKVKKSIQGKGKDLFVTEYKPAAN